MRLGPRRLAPALVAAFLLSVLAPATSLGAVTGLSSPRGSGPLDSATSKSATAACPAGSQVLGTAASKTHAPPFGQVRMVEVVPGAELTSVRSTFREDETGFSDNWQPFAYALCAPLPGLQRVAKTSPSNSSNKNVVAACPSGKRLVGTGSATSGGLGQVMIDVIRPDAGLTGVTVTGREDQNGFSGNWTVTAYALCAPPPQGLERVSANGAVSANAPDVVADCPAGKGLLGVGGEASGQSGQVSLETYPLAASGAPVDSEPARGVARAFEDEDGYAPAWTLTAYAICANTAVRVESTSGRNSEGKSSTATCPAAKHVTGAGAEITGGVGEVPLDAFGPNPQNPPTSAFTEAFEDQDGTERTWSLTAYSICASPLSGLEVVAATSPAGSSDSQSIEAPCPAGKQVVGAGGGLENGVGGVVLSVARPDLTMTKVLAVGEEDEDGHPDPWTVTAYAVCANPPPGLQVVSAQSETDSEESKSVSAACPAGKHLLGIGATVSNSDGQVVIDDLRPDLGLRSVRVTANEDQDGYSNPWTVYADAICANY